MHAKKTSKLLAILFALPLLSCATITIPDAKVCAVAGLLSGGANCAHTNFEKKEEMDLGEFINFLEPASDSKKAPAICQSADDWNKQKTALEQACEVMGAKCTYQKQLMDSARRIDTLIKSSMRPK